jgi:hypothetical protein
MLYNFSLILEHISGAVCSFATGAFSFATGDITLSTAKLLQFALLLEPLYSVALREECAFKFCNIGASAGTIPFQDLGILLTCYKSEIGAAGIFETGARPI